MIFNLVTLCIVSFLLGIYFSKWSQKISKKRENLQKISDTNKQYKQVLEKVKTKKSRFKTRINNTVFIGVKLEDYGRVDLLYFLDKNDLAIFKGEKCIMTSTDVSTDLMRDLIENINRVHHHKIDDVVEVLGFVFYREDFERNFNVNFKEIKEKADHIMKTLEENQSDIDKIIKRNNDKLDIDEVLDKINKVGIENLTKEELEFLNNYNK